MKKDKENVRLEEYSSRLANNFSICLRRVYRLTYDAFVINANSKWFWWPKCAISSENTGTRVPRNLRPVSEPKNKNKKLRQMFTNDIVTADSRRPDLNVHQMKKALGKWWKLFCRLSTIAFLLSRGFYKW